MKKALVFALVVAGIAATSASAVQRGSSPNVIRASTAATAACTSAPIGFMGPITGPVAFLGKEQLNWAKFSIDRFNAANGTRFTVLQGDTQLNPKLALTVGTKFTANRSLLA